MSIVILNYEQNDPQYINCGIINLFSKLYN